MYPLRSFVKDPAATLDYTVDWGGDDWLGSDTISAVSWTTPAGLTLASSSNTTTTATAWLGGGIDGQDYDVVCQITTTGGRIDERTIRLQVRQR